MQWIDACNASHPKLPVRNLPFVNFLDVIHRQYETTQNKEEAHPQKTFFKHLLIALVQYRIGVVDKLQMTHKNHECKEKPKGS